jgi:hypothetical protein
VIFIFSWTRYWCEENTLVCCFLNIKEDISCLYLFVQYYLSFSNTSPMQLWFVICSCRKSKFSSCESLIQKIWVVTLQVVSTVEEIQERHDAVKEIEKKLLDLHQVYLQEYLGLQYLFSWQLIIIMSNPILLFLRFTLTWQCWLMLKEKL